ncbi:hypothetical protein D3C72_2454770 [compost metagenome]
MDQVRRLGKLNSTRHQRRIGLADIGDPKIQHRFRARLGAFMQIEPQATAIEKTQSAETVKMGQAQNVAIPVGRGRNVPHIARHLP